MDRAEPRIMSRSVRAGVLAVALVLSAQSTGGAAGTAAPSREATQRFRVETLGAEWIMPTGSDDAFHYIVVRAIRKTDLDTDEVTLHGSAGVGACSSTDDAFSCEAMLPSYRVTRFETDDLFREATVVLRRGTKRHRIAWTATQPYAYVPPAEVTPELCGQEEGTATRIYLLAQNATAEGRVFGRKLSTSDEYEPQRAAETMLETIDIEECP